MARLSRNSLETGSGSLGGSCVVHQHAESRRKRSAASRIREALGTLSERSRSLRASRRPLRQRHAFDAEHRAGVAGWQRSQRQRLDISRRSLADKAVVDDTAQRRRLRRGSSISELHRKRVRPRSTPVRLHLGNAGIRGLPGATARKRRFQVFLAVVLAKDHRLGGALAERICQGAGNECPLTSMVMGALRPWAVLLAEID